MTVLENVENLIIRSSPNALCDDCIADQLRLSVRQHANHKTRELSKSLEFDQRVDVCASCGSMKLVIVHTNAPVYLA
jgi:hypothetical protein